MNISSTRGKTNHWQHQQNVGQITKRHRKFDVDPGTSHFSGNVQYYNDNNRLKHTLSGSDQHRAPFKKRQFTQQIISPIQTDEDDSNTGNISSKTMNRIERAEYRRRAAHTAAEQKRRNAIRKGYDALQSLVPNSHLLDPISSQKVSKAAILKRSTDYLVQLHKEKQQLNNQLEAEKKETFCLRAVQKAYEDILEMNKYSSKNVNTSIDDEQKFKVFQNITDAIFIPFDQAMHTGQIPSFNQFTSIILRWIEDSCRPSDINEIIRRVFE